MKLNTVCNGFLWVYSSRLFTMIMCLILCNLERKKNIMVFLVCQSTIWTGSSELPVWFGKNEFSDILASNINRKISKI